MTTTFESGPVSAVKFLQDDSSEDLQCVINNLADALLVERQYRSSVELTDLINLYVLNLERGPISIKIKGGKNDLEYKGLSFCIHKNTFLLSFFDLK